MTGPIPDPVTVSRADLNCLLAHYWDEVLGQPARSHWRLPLLREAVQRIAETIWRQAGRTSRDEIRRAYDPLPDLAQVLAAVLYHAPNGITSVDGRALRRLRRGLGLFADHPASPSATAELAEAAIREALTSFITKTGKLLGPDELAAYAAEAERGYDLPVAKQAPANPYALSAERIIQLAQRLRHPGEPGDDRNLPAWPVQYGSLEELTEALRGGPPREMLAAGRVYSVRYGPAESHVHEGGRYGVPGYRHSHLAGAEPHEHEEMVLDPPPGFTGHAPEPHPELGPGSGHQVDGPAGCSRCQLLRDNQDWII